MKGRNGNSKIKEKKNLGIKREGMNNMLGVGIVWFIVCIFYCKYRNEIGRFLRWNFLVFLDS